METLLGALFSYSTVYPTCRNIRPEGGRKENICDPISVKVPPSHIPHHHHEPGTEERENFISFQMLSGRGGTC